MNNQTTEVEPPPPYFPSAFATSPDEPRSFNFNLAVLDSLELPSPISGPGELTTPSGKITFREKKEAVQYCREKLRPWREAALDKISTPRNSTQQLTAERKEELFMGEGRSLEPYLCSGIPEMDQNLGRVREDR